MTTMAQDRAWPAPVVYPDNAEFWAGTAAGQLLVRHCEDCGKPHWYPRTQCPFCMSDRTAFKPSAGKGSIYSFTVCRRVGPVPFAIAYVRLDEGITMLTNIVDCDLDALRIGQRLRVAFKASDGVLAIPVFVPA